MTPGASARPVRLDPAERDRSVRRVLVTVLWLNLAVVAAKAAAYLSSNALSVVAETTHSSLDAANNVLALWVARVAARAPDAEHPYGHRKFETLGALALVGFLSVTVFELLKSAVRRLTAPSPPLVEGTPLALAILGLSVVAGVLVAAYESRNGKAIGSDLLLADAAHTRADVFTTLAVLGGLVLVRLGLPQADPVLTLVVAGIIAWTGWQIVKRSVPVLVDERAVDPESIRRLAEEDDGVLSCYRIRSRGRPGDIYAELTISVDPALDVGRSHAIADRVEQRVADALEARDVLVHVEPAGG